MHICGHIHTSIYEMEGIWRHTHTNTLILQNGRTEIANRWWKRLRRENYQRNNPKGHILGGKISKDRDKQLFFSCTFIMSKAKDVIKLIHS